MVSKYCPKCGSVLEVRYKCSGCRWVGPVLYGNSSKVLKEVKKMEKEESAEERLKRAEDELRIVERAIKKLEPLREEYDINAEGVRKLLKEVMYKLSLIKVIDREVKEVCDGIDEELKGEILADVFSASDRVVLDYVSKGWELRLLAYFGGEK